MHMDAYYKGLRRGRGIHSDVAPPNDVIVAVDMAKSQHLHNQRISGLNGNINGWESPDSFRRPAPLNIPLNSNSADLQEANRHDVNLPPKHQNMPQAYNGYSIGAAPDGMRRKYVDILNSSETHNFIESSRNSTSSMLDAKQHQKKKSPVKSSPRKKTPAGSNGDIYSSSTKYLSSSGLTQTNFQQQHARKSYV